jgi:hypothetical protein
MDDGLLHDLVLYPQGRSQRYPLNWKLDSLYNRSELCRENRMSLTEIEPRFSGSLAHDLVTKPNAVPGFVCE